MAGKGKKQMVCKCCTHQHFISAGDGCMAFALNRVAGSRAEGLGAKKRINCDRNHLLLGHIIQQQVKR